MDIDAMDRRLRNLEAAFDSSIKTINSRVDAALEKVDSALAQVNEVLTRLEAELIPPVPVDDVQPPADIEEAPKE